MYLNDQMYAINGLDSEHISTRILLCLCVQYMQKLNASYFVSKQRSKYLVIRWNMAKKNFRIVTNICPTYNGHGWKNQLTVILFCDFTGNKPVALR